LVLSAISLPQTAGAQASATTAKLPPALEAAITQSHEALREILNGDPSGYAALYADRDDITVKSLAIMALTHIW
jgi:hypothetical protein